MCFFSSLTSGFVPLRSPLHGVLPPFASPAGVAVLGWYVWAVICSHVCALANERPAPRLCACVSPPTTLTAYVGCFFAFASQHSLALSTSFHPDDDAPNDARRAPTVVRRSTLDVLNSAPNRRSTQLDTNVRYTIRSCVPPRSRHPVNVLLC